MAHGIKMHGITLAKNSWFENLSLEQLAQDPSPIAANRVWVNSAEKVVKYSILDSEGAVVIKVIADAASLQAAISALSSSVAAETVRAEAAEQALGLRVDALGNVFNYVATVEGGVDEAAAFDLSTFTPENKEAGDYYKVAVGGFFKSSAAGVAFHANQGDGLVWNLLGDIDVIDNTNSQVTGVASFVDVTGSAETGFIVDIAQAFKGRVVALETGLAAETSRAQAAETANANAITQEATDRAAAVAAEAARAKAAETVNADAIAAEATRAQGAEAGLQSAIDALEAAAGAGSEALKVSLNGRIFNFKSAAPALSHVITHNLNTEFYSVQLMIKNAEGKFVNDIAPVAEDVVDPLNKLVVTLSEAADVKVSVESRSSIV